MNSSCESSCEQSNCKREEPSTEERFDHLAISQERRCTKCGEEEPAAMDACNGLCAACFRAYLYGKFKLAVTSNAMIAPTDRVLLAYSGGPASRVVLEFVHEMQSKSLQSWAASNSQSLPVFSVGVVFVNEFYDSAIPSDAIQAAIEERKSVVLDLSPPKKEFYVLQIEDVFSKNGKNELRELLSDINDETGKEDFLGYLRMSALQKVALENGYNKLVLGSCASSIARQIISSTVKGQGYSLPADIQYVDTRYKVPLVLPIRDILQQELITLCNIDRLKTQQLFERPRAGINALVSSFVTQLREENPSREHTILRTAGKLKPFKFNKFSSNDSKFLPSRIRPKFTENISDESDDLFCLICSSPLTKKETEIKKEMEIKKEESFVSSFCETCGFQIVPKGRVERENFFEMLPKEFVKRSILREEIKDYLLDGDIDE
ncbi:hypothetical protein LUZ60_004964 [Juncus effusus]|nr:hypothetical protein LUZ60_004964 [Juncus effusus]